jgi:hypothetical protein
MKILLLSHIRSGRVRSGIGSSSVGSFWVLSRIRSGQTSGHLVSGHFGFRVISGRVGSGIGSYSVGSFQVSGRIKSSIGSFSIGLFRVMVVSGQGGFLRSGRVLPPLVYISQHISIWIFTPPNLKNKYLSFKISKS